MNDTGDDAQIGGVHIKYLEHCPRQLWLYARGYRPEGGSDLVSLGEAVDATTFTRRRDIDLGEARIDWVGVGAVVHETKSSRRPSPAHEAQVRHYCLLLSQRGVDVRKGVIHYPLIRRTVDVPWDEEARQRAEMVEARARATIHRPSRRPGCSALTARDAPTSTTAGGSDRGRHRAHVLADRALPYPA